MGATTPDTTIRPPARWRTSSDLPQGHKKSLALLRTRHERRNPPVSRTGSTPTLFVRESERRRGKLRPGRHEPKQHAQQRGVPQQTRDGEKERERARERERAAQAEPQASRRALRTPGNMERVWLRPRATRMGVNLVSRTGQPPDILTDRRANPPTFLTDRARDPGECSTRDNTSQKHGHQRRVPRQTRDGEKERDAEREREREREGSSGGTTSQP